MKNNKIWLLLFLLIFSLSSFAKPKMDTLTEKINAALSKFGENLNIGILVQNAKSGQILYKKNIDRYFMPASSQKLFTAFAALNALGPDFRFNTQLFADYKKIKENTLQDNLYLKFSGDPSLTSAQLEFLIHSLVEAGIQEIQGKVIIDDGVFDQMTRSPGSSWEDQEFCWGSPISGIMIDRNCVRATILPAEKSGEPAIIQLPNFPQSLSFINKVKTESATEKSCRIHLKPIDKTKFILNGCINLGSKPQLIEMAINNPRENLLSLLIYLFNKKEIIVKRGFEFVPFEAFPKAFARQDSPPLKDLLSILLKESDNRIADSLFKTMGANFSHEVGSYVNGSKAVRAIFEETLKLQLPQTTLVDGSGASRYNFLKPEQIVYLLQKIYQSPNAADFINSLAISGVDGTLKDRFKDPALRGKIHAKTGSGTAITTLSGFLETKNKQTLIFSIMINGYTNPSSKYKALEEELCKILVET